MSIEEEEQSHGMEEDDQHPQYYMPRKLKHVAAAEGNLREMLRRESRIHNQQMQKVPRVLRLGNDSNDYDPMVVALGPYHHGEKNLRPAENFKVKALQHIIVDTGKSVQFLFDVVFDRVSVVRSYYTEDSTNKFDDSTLAEMMLLDTCFIINYILAATKPIFASTMLSDFGQMDFAIISRDLFLLENQIPLWFLKYVMFNMGRSVLLSEFDGFKTSVYLCCKFRFSWHKWTYLFRWLMTGKTKKKFHDDNTWEQEKYDIDDYNSAQEKYKIDAYNSAQEKYDDYSWEQYVPCFHSASDLKAKGIHIRASRDHSLTGICFKSSYYYPQLQLPILHVSSHTKVIFSNLIAYESCLKSPTEQNVTAYIHFMKSLILHADDVKVLREKGILFTSLSRDEVVKMFKELNTTILSTKRPMEKARVEIRKYISSKFKSWLGEFLYTYFGSPWIAIGTVSAILLLFLTLAQTYFTVRCA